jgi:hypothetical protein
MLSIEGCASISIYPLHHATAPKTLADVLLVGGHITIAQECKCGLVCDLNPKIPWRKNEHVHNLILSEMDEGC